MRSITLRSTVRYTYLSAVVITAVACGSISDVGDGTTSEPLSTLQQALVPDGQVCVTVQQGVSGQAQDAIVWQAAPTWNNSTSGRLRTGTSASGGYSRSLLHFDLGGVPAGATVTSANLSLVQNFKTGASSTVNVLRATAPWSEATVTWNNFGGAFDPAPVASFQAIGGGGSGLRTIDLSDLVQDWLSGAAPNHGVVLDDPTDPAATELRSSKSPYVDQRPALTVCYVTCNDGIQNGEETGFDCGGPYCGECNPDPGPPVGPMVEPSGTSLLVQVASPSGPIAGAKVETDGAEVLTDANGYVLLENLAPGQVVAQVQAAGFAPGTVVTELEAGVHGGTTISLLPLSPPVAFDASADATVVSDEVQVDIPAGSLLDENGEPVTGTAELNVAPLDPTTADLASAPGPFLGIPEDGSAPVNLESGFMAEIQLTQNGKPVQLAPGATATITFALPPSVAATLAVGELVPAWWFDLSEGVWRQEGFGVVEPSAQDPTQLVWTVEVAHFTWWNIDKPFATQSCVNVTVRDQNGNPLPGRNVTARGVDYNYQRTVVTGANGVACMPLKLNSAAQVTVGSFWDPQDTQSITPSANATCGGSCQSLTFTLAVPCGVAGTLQPCSFTGPGTPGTGICKAGNRVCNGFTWGSCAGQVNATAEVCGNGVDEDCQGELNNGCPIICTDGTSEGCYTGPAGTADIGRCKSGTSTCVNGAPSACAGEVHPVPEDCSTPDDDDCDGTANEGCLCPLESYDHDNNPSTPEVPVQVDCYNGPINTLNVGQCVGGKRVCHENGASVFWGACKGEVLPEPETCDGVDEDCDGEVDDGNVGAGAACATGQPGVCAAGTTSCTNGALVCNPNVPASTETCDGVDNDCDGAADDNIPDVGTACSTGNPGICAAGTLDCFSGIPTCVQTNQPVAENCATPVDDDCDGQANEGCPTTVSYYSYTASSTSNATVNTYNHIVTLPGGTAVQIGTCGIPGASANGDTWLRLVNPSGVEVASNDDSCGNLSTYILYNVPAGAGGTYTIRSGCFSSQSCSGTVAIAY